MKAVWSTISHAQAWRSYGRHAFLVISEEGFLPGRDTEKVDEKFQKWDLRRGSN